MTVVSFKAAPAALAENLRGRGHVAAGARSGNRLLTECLYDVGHSEARSLSAVRYAKGHKEETRRRIIDTASRLFREKGVERVGLDEIMREAGLTHGGFYAHFPSKEHLIAEA